MMGGKKRKKNQTQSPPNLRGGGKNRNRRPRPAEDEQIHQVSGKNIVPTPGVEKKDEGTKPSPGLVGKATEQSQGEGDYGGKWVPLT